MNVNWGEKTFKANKEVLDKLNQERVINYISTILKDDLESFCGDRVDKESRGHITNAVFKVLSNFSKNGLLAKEEPFKVGKCSSLWQRWKLGEKTKWVLCNKTFKWIGRDTRRNIDVIYEKLTMLAVMLPTEEQEANAHWTVMDEQHKYPQWAIPTPKSILITDIMIRPVQSVESINLTFKM